MFPPCFPVLALSRWWPYPLNSKDFERAPLISQCASHRQRASSPNFISPLSSWAQALWLPRFPQSVGSLIHLSIEFSSGHKRCPLSYAPSSDLSLFPFPSPPNLWSKMLTQTHHQISHGCQALHNPLCECCAKKMLNHNAYTQNVDELPPSYLVQACALFRVKERSGAWDVWLVTRWKK